MPFSDITPNPDPTILTREASARAKEATNLADDLRDKAIQRELKLRKEQRDEQTASLAKNIHSSSKHDRQLFNAKLQTIKAEIKADRRIAKLLEAQRVERKDDDRISLSAALAAAEKSRIADTAAIDKANTKTELSTAEQLKQQNTTSGQGNSNTVASVNALTTRVERIENLKQGASDVTGERRANAGLYWAIAGVVVAVFVAFNGLIFGIVGIIGTYMLTKG